MFGVEEKLAKKLSEHLEARKVEWSEFADKRQAENVASNRDDVLIARAVAIMCTIMKNAIEESVK